MTLEFSWYIAFYLALWIVGKWHVAFVKRVYKWVREHVSTWPSNVDRNAVIGERRKIVVESQHDN